MTYCKGKRAKQRQTKPHGSSGSYHALNPYKRSFKGHSWVGHGRGRVCADCGERPKGLLYIERLIDFFDKEKVSA